MRTYGRIDAYFGADDDAYSRLCGNAVFPQALFWSVRFPLVVGGAAMQRSNDALAVAYLIVGVSLIGVIVGVVLRNYPYAIESFSAACAGWALVYSQKQLRHLRSDHF